MDRKPPSPSEPVTELRRVKIVECGEPLVDFMEACPSLRQDRPRFHYRRETLVRAPIAPMLEEAARSLPSGYHLAIVEGWRAPLIQDRMYRGIWRRFQNRHPDWSDVQLRRVVNRYTAPVNDRVPPPHSTGGAVDVFLVREDGSPYDHTTPYDRYDTKCFSFDCTGLSDAAKRTRELLWSAMSRTALTNYPSEYWHWSYGDQGWAYRGGHEHAIYGQIVPPDWTPDPNDCTDEPLILIES